MTRLEVRCCCDPRKLLGWLDVERIDSPLILCNLIAPGNDLSAPVETLALEIAPLVVPGFENLGSYRAIKSNDVPIETLRKIPGFVEFTEEQVK